MKAAMATTTAINQGLNFGTHTAADRAAVPAGGLVGARPPLSGVSAMGSGSGGLGLFRCENAEASWAHPGLLQEDFGFNRHSDAQGVVGILSWVEDDFNGIARGVFWRQQAEARTA